MFMLVIEYGTINVFIFDKYNPIYLLTYDIMHAWIYIYVILSLKISILLLLFPFFGFSYLFIKLPSFILRDDMMQPCLLYLKDKQPKPESRHIRNTSSLYPLLVFSTKLLTKNIENSVSQIYSHYVFQQHVIGHRTIQSDEGRVPTSESIFRSKGNITDRLIGRVK